MTLPWLDWLDLHCDGDCPHLAVSVWPGVVVSPVCAEATIVAWLRQGGDVVTIAGVNFGRILTACAVAIDGRVCTVLSLTEGAITCVAPPGVAGLVTPVVTVSGLTSPAVPPTTTSPGVVQYAPPVVTAFTPSFDHTTGSCEVYSRVARSVGVPCVVCGGLWRGMCRCSALA